MKMLKLILVLFVIILISGCSYIQQFKESSAGNNEEPFISIIPEEEIAEEAEKTAPVEEISKETKEEAKPETKLEVKEGELIKLKLAATDPDGDLLTYKFSFPLNEKGEWQTKSGDAGEYKVKIMVDDGKISSEKEVLIVVKAINRAPVLEVGDITVNEGESVKLIPEISDSDEDKVIVTYSGWMTSSTYETKYDDAGVYTVTVTASDGKAEVSKNIKVTVNDVNRAPVIESITLE